MAPPLKDYVAQSVAFNLFRIVHRDSRARLESLELRFTRFMVQDRMQCIPIEWPVQVKRVKEPGDNVRQLYGNVDFTVESKGRWW